MMKVFHFTVFLLTTLTLLSACSESDQQVTSTDPFDNLPVLKLSAPLDITDHDSISNGRFFFQSKYFRDMAISKKGDIFVSNFRGKSIQQFDSEGQFITNIGAEGRGPGEFQAAPYFDIRGKDTLFTLDGSSWMINSFTYAGEHWISSNSFVLDHKNDADPVDIYLVDKTRMAVEFTPGFQLLMKDNTSSELHKTIAVVSNNGQNLTDSLLTAPVDQKSVFKSDGGATLIQDVPYGTRSIFKPGPDGSLYHLNTDRFLIKIYDKNGSLKDSIKHSNFSVEITEEQRRTKVEEEVTASTGSDREDRVMKENMFEQMPTTTHPLNDMFVDRDTGFIIIKRSELYDGPNWLLLNPEGERLGVFDLSESLEVFDFRKGKIVGTLMSEDPEVLPTVRVVSFSDEIF